MMKKLILIGALCAFFSPELSAQTSKSTVLNIEVAVQHEVVRRGPYARYAQQFLGAVAPLSDKENYSLLSATVSATPAELDPAPAAEPAALFPAVEGWDGVQVDKLSLAESSLEQAAAEAARTLFTLRQRRFDLVTGEAGENVYGPGMEAALQEMKRLEEEYIALFMGRRTVQVEERTIRIVPEKGHNTLIVGRFTEAAGLLPADDLSGRPIVLELTPESTAPVSAAPARSGREAMVSVRVAAPVRYRLVEGNAVLAAGSLLIDQFGETVEVPASSLR